MRRAIDSQTTIRPVSKDEKGRRQPDLHWNSFKGRERPSTARPTLELFRRTRKAIDGQTNIGTASEDERDHRQPDQDWDYFRERERPSITRPILQQFQRRHWGNSLEMGWNAFGLSLARRYHLQLNLNSPTHRAENSGNLTFNTKSIMPVISGRFQEKKIHALAPAPSG